MTKVNLEELITKTKAKKEKETSKTALQHGLSKTRLYKIFKKMKERCYCSYNENYKYYGERGITIYEPWLKDFCIFYRWALANGYEESLTIERINVNGNYEPSNCKWATVKEQNNNRRDNHYVTINSKTQTFTQWCEYYDIHPVTARRRIDWGWTEDLALSVPKSFTGKTIVLGL